MKRVLLTVVAFMFMVPSISNGLPKVPDYVPPVRESAFTPGMAPDVAFFFRPAPSWSEAATVDEEESDDFRAFDSTYQSVLAVRSEESVGTGVRVGPTEIATACHTLDVESQLAAHVPDAKVIYDRRPAVYRTEPDGTTAVDALDAELVARDEDHDLCLLFCPALLDHPLVKPVPFGSARDLSENDNILLTSIPTGERHGSVMVPWTCDDSADGHTPLDACDQPMQSFLVRVHAQPGSSGGAVLRDGRLVGVALGRFRPVPKATVVVPVELVERLLQDHDRDRTLRRTARDKSRSGDYDTALALARQIVDSHEGIWAYNTIAVDQAREGRVLGARAAFAAAIDIANGIGRRRDSWLRRVAKRQIRAGSFVKRLLADARVTAEMIGDETLKAEMLQRVDRAVERASARRRRR